MDGKLFRAYLVELVGTFAFVFFASGLACVNAMTSVTETSPGLTPLATQQPGLLGVAMGQALVWLALIAWSAPVSGGYLNPAVAIARWVFNRLSSDRLAWFIDAQILGAVLAGLALQLIFEPAILKTAQFGAPYLNTLAFGSLSSGSIWAGMGIELVLTFFFVLAMFTTTEQAPAPWLSGAVLAAAVLFAGPLTGAGLNPARWLGPVFWQMIDGSAGNLASRQALVYIAGPIVGALLAGAFAFRVYLPARLEAPKSTGP
ncbi:MAG: aquaporin [Planctomycetota bacterium]